MVKVIFEYDETTRKWDPIVNGTISPIEARQAFNAVVLTCKELDPELLNRGLVELISPATFRILPAV